jgi:cytochrome oxidase Cu insertion factor (SCO1/SenC/PrrC family)
MPRFLLLLPLIALAGCSPSPGRHALPTNNGGAPDLDFPVGSFSLTERSGKTVTDADLKGKVWVASFVFTRCTGPCPQVTATVARLQRELPDNPDLRFVTFTVDPTRDDPNELKRYADHFKAAAARWLFLTGDEAAIHTLLRERFKQAANRKPGKPEPGDEFDHSTRLVVVDRKGVMRATFPGVRGGTGPESEPEFEDGLRRLREKVAALLAEP